MRNSKQTKQKRERLNKTNSEQGRTKIQRANKMKKAIVNHYDGRLGELKGETFREKYAHLHRLTGDENTRLRKIAEAEEEAKKNGLGQ